MPALQMLDNIVPISDFSHGKSSAAFSKVAENNPVVVLRRNAPAFVIVTPDEYRRAKEAEEDLKLLSLALSRVSAHSEEDLVPFAEAMERLGVTQADLDAIDEAEFE